MREYIICGFLLLSNSGKVAFSCLSFMKLHLQFPNEIVSFLHASQRSLSITIRLLKLCLPNLKLDNRLLSGLSKQVTVKNICLQCKQQSMFNHYSTRIDILPKFSSSRPCNIEKSRLSSFSGNIPLICTEKIPMTLELQRKCNL